VRLSLAGLAVVALCCGCLSGNDGGNGAGTASSVERLEQAITADGLREHLFALQRIATENDGTRASGTPGYAASVDYVAAELRKAGYTPRLQRFRYTDTRRMAPPELAEISPEATTYEEAADFVPLRYSGSGDVDAIVQPVNPDSTASGCAKSDFDGFERGSIALVRRGGCFFVVKVDNAASAGAAAVLVFNDGSPGYENPIEATLLRPTRLPALSFSNALGETLVRETDEQPVRLHLAASFEAVEREAANVLADLPGRERGPAMLLGAHLDSVDAGPGINDNGSGVATLLELAAQARRLGFRPGQPIRFGFWAGEEAGLVGSSKYVESLGDDPSAEIAAVVNLDMVGSPNAEAFVYEGDGTIESALDEAVRDEGLDPLPVDLENRSDHGPFAEAGIPVGGLFTGADDTGPDGKPHDPCYHRACDTIDNVDMSTLERMADALAVAVFSSLTRSD
jgi:Zn-dependent M28 family amino/carboxypeptidase